MGPEKFLTPLAPQRVALHWLCSIAASGKPTTGQTEVPPAEMTTWTAPTSELFTRRSTMIRMSLICSRRGGTSAYRDERRGAIL